MSPLSSESHPLRLLLSPPLASYITHLLLHHQFLCYLGNSSMFSSPITSSTKLLCWRKAAKTHDISIVLRFSYLHIISEELGSSFCLFSSIFCECNMQFYSIVATVTNLQSYATSCSIHRVPCRSQHALLTSEQPKFVSK